MKCVYSLGEMWISPHQEHFTRFFAVQLWKILCISEKRSSDIFIHDIIEAIEKIESYIAEFSYEEFLLDQKTQDAVLRNLEIIGEAARRIDPIVQAQISDIDWSGMIGMRNFICHQYFHTDWQIVWDTCNNEIIVLKQQLTRYGYG